MRSKLALLLAVVFLMASLLMGCGAQQPGPTETQEEAETPAETEQPAAVETVKIGAILPLTGGAAATGVKLQAAMEVAQDIINGEYPELAKVPLAKETGLPNLGNAKLEIVFADHQGNPEMAKSEAERLIEQGVAGLVGSYQSSCTKPASQAAEQYGVPFVAGSSSSAALTERGLNYFVRVAPNDDIETAMFFDYLIHLNEKYNAGIKTVAVAYIDNEFGVHAKEMVEKWVKEKYGALGFELVGVVPYAVDVTNVDTEVQQIKSLNADAIFHASYIADITMFVNKYKEFKVNPKAVLNYCGGFQDTQFVVNLGNDGDYFAGGAAFSADKLGDMPELAAINKMYKAKTGADLDGPALEEFASVLVLAEAINMAGNLDGDAIIDVIKKTEFKAPYFATGAIKFDAKGQNEILASYVVQTQNKEYRAVYPVEIATVEPVAPIPQWDKR